jgi:hypothetical protein
LLGGCLAADEVERLHACELGELDEVVTDG